MKKDTQELASILEDYILETHKPDNDHTNHWIRRFFRCYIDGSYKGQEHYKTNCTYVQAHKDEPRRIRSFAISSFLDFLNVEFPDINRQTIQKLIVKIFIPHELEKLNAELVDDYKDLVAE